MAKEERLARKAIRGNVDAYGELIELHKEYLYRMAFLYMKNEQDALDLVSDCILKGFEKIHALKDPDLFKTWITRILINGAKDMFRRAKPVISSDETMELESPENGISTEEKCDLYQAIDTLRPTYKTIVILKYFQNMKLKEIAEVMDIPEGSVSAYLTKAKQELRSYLMDYECPSI